MSFPGTCLCQAAFNVLLFRGDTHNSSGKKELPLSFFRSEKWDSERLSTLLRVSQPVLKPRSVSLFLPVSYRRHGPFLGLLCRKKREACCHLEPFRKRIAFSVFWLDNYLMLLPSFTFALSLRYQILNVTSQSGSPLHAILPQKKGHDFCPSFSLPLSLLPLGLLLRSLFQDITNGLFLSFLYMLFQLDFINTPPTQTDRGCRVYVCACTCYS